MFVSARRLWGVLASLALLGCGEGAEPNDTPGAGGSGAGATLGPSASTSAGAGTGTNTSIGTGATGTTASSSSTGADNGSVQNAASATTTGTLDTTATGAGGASSTGSSSSGSTPLGTLSVSNLQIEPNPRMSLSCYVSWTTSEPANSEVQFGVGGYQLRVVDTREVTEHRVHVVGMHAETTYSIKAVSTNTTATGSAEGDFTTGALPSELPAQGRLVADERAKMQPGWTLTNYQVGGSSNFSTSPGIMVIVDDDGIPVWYFVHGDTPDQFGMTSIDWLGDGRILVGNASAEPAREVDLEGNILWEGPTGGNPALSHHTGKLKTGNYLVLRESNASARVEEIGPDHSVVWSWDLYDYVQPTSNAADWCHLNAVSVSPAEDFLYFNCRFQGLYKVSRSDKQIVWHMGAAIDDSSSGDVVYLPDNSARFNDAHDPEVHEDGTVLFYDNQGWANHMGGEGNGSFHSRVVEYTLDEASKQATLTWEFPGNFDVDPWYTEEWMTPIWGEADRLANGNVLVTAGARGAGTHTRIFEVTREGEVVWGIEWPENNGSYRADRISPPLAERIP